MRAIQGRMWHKKSTYVRYPELGRHGVRDFSGEGSCDVWSMDRQGIRTSFDQESKRLKQVELSAPRRERVSLDTYADALAAREAEFRQEAKYSEWFESESNVWR